MRDLRKSIRELANVVNVLADESSSYEDLMAVIAECSEDNREEIRRAVIDVLADQSAQI